MELSEAIKELRGERTQAEFAQMLRVDVQSISRYERGAPPAFGVLWKMARLAQQQGRTDLVDYFADAAARGIGISGSELKSGIRGNTEGLPNICSGVDPDFLAKLCDVLTYPRNGPEEKFADYVRGYVSEIRGYIKES